MDSLWTSAIGFILGFGFGVGCALAVMYSIYMGGYRTAVREGRQTPRPARYDAAVAKLPPMPHPSAPA